MYLFQLYKELSRYKKNEPTSGLDLRHMQQVSDVLRLLREEGRTVLVITHDWELVREAADGVVEMGSSEAV